MLNNFIEMDFDKWFETYKPIKNELDNNASFNGYMFETYGDEVVLVNSVDHNLVWTYGDGDDGGSYIWNGRSFVNRIGYFITEIPCPIDTDIQIQISIPWFYCENCDAELEDEGGLINDKFGGFDFCPECVTPEQLKEIEEYNAMV